MTPAEAWQTIKDYAAMALGLIPPSTPIEETRAALALPPTVSLPTAVRTAGDLLVALERKEVEVSAAQAKKIKEMIG